MKKVNMNNKMAVERLEKLVKQFEVLTNNYDFCLGEFATFEDRQTVKKQLEALDYNIERLVDLTKKNIFDILDHKLNINYKRKIDITKLVIISEWVDYIEDETTRNVLEALDELNYFKDSLVAHKRLDNLLVELVKNNGNENIIKRAERVLIDFRNEYHYKYDEIIEFKSLKNFN